MGGLRSFRGLILPYDGARPLSPGVWAADARHRSGRAVVLVSSIRMPSQRLSAGMDRGRDPAAHAQLGHNVLDVLFDRGFAEDKALSDLAVGQAKRQQLQHLLFAAG